MYRQAGRASSDRPPPPRRPPDTPSLDAARCKHTRTDERASLYSDRVPNGITIDRSSELGLCFRVVRSLRPSATRRRARPPSGHPPRYRSTDVPYRSGRNCAQSRGRGSTKLSQPSCKVVTVGIDSNPAVIGDYFCLQTSKTPLIRRLQRQTTTLRRNNLCQL